MVRSSFLLSIAVTLISGWISGCCCGAEHPDPAIESEVVDSGTSDTIPVPPSVPGFATENPRRFKPFPKKVQTPNPKSTSSAKPTPSAQPPKAVDYGSLTRCRTNWGCPPGEVCCSNNGLYYGSCVVKAYCKREKTQ
jgi:hypothetical protein